MAVVLNARNAWLTAPHATLHLMVRTLGQDITKSKPEQDEHHDDASSVFDGHREIRCALTHTRTRLETSARKIGSFDSGHDNITMPPFVEQRKNKQDYALFLHSRGP